MGARRTLFVSHKTFTTMLSDLIASGVGFDSKEQEGGIMITFNGAY